MSRVFIVHQPTGRDKITGAIKPIMDLTPALEFGDLHFILREWENPFADATSTSAEVRRILELNDFGDEDWLLLVGNPALIGIVAAIAADITGGELRMLQWNKADRCYSTVIAQVDLID